MNTQNIRRRLHAFIDAVEDKKAAAIYTIFEDDMDTDNLRKKLIEAEREAYLKGDGKNFSPAQVKQMALNKVMRNDL